MNISIMQPYFMPYIGYWQLMATSDVFVYYDDATYIKQGWINRNRIALSGKEHLFTLSVNGASSNKPIRSLSVGDNRPKLYETLRHAYAKAPFFNLFKPVLESILFSTENNLCNYIAQSNQTILAYLGIEVKIIRSSDLDIASTARDAKIIEICHALNGTCYTNPIGGANLYRTDKFTKAGISLRFLTPTMRPYSQLTPSFIPGLSILDILVNNPREAVVDMLFEGVITLGQ